jgi:acyl dehydratase
LEDLQMAAIEIQTLDQVEALVGTEIGVSGWKEIDQPAVNLFADVTGDHQWIHVDTERAAASDFGGTIVHGLFTLSLGSQWEEELIEFTGFEFALNYGYDKVRFPASLPVGRRLRMRLSVQSVRPYGAGVLVCMRETFEAEGQDKPVCVADALAWLPAEDGGAE